jgi:sarcosine oxidase subunit beta
MFSQRGVLNLGHTPAQLDDFARRGNAMRHLDGIDAVLMTPAEIKKLMPAISISRRCARFPILGGLMQWRAGTARHDAVAWGYARGADRRGVDILENCEVTGFIKDGDRIVGVRDLARRNPRQEDRRGRCRLDRPRHLVAAWRASTKCR